jgi:hypothetical protein
MEPKKRGFVLGKNSSRVGPIQKEGRPKAIVGRSDSSIIH